MEDRVIIIGGYGTALNIAETIDLQYSNIEGFVIDDKKLNGKVGAFKIISSLNNLGKLIKDYDYKVVFALYRPDVLKERYHLLQSLNIPKKNLFSFIHESSYVSPSVKIGDGVIIMPNCTIQSNVTINDNTIINSNCIIEHDTNIGLGCFVSAGSIIGSKVDIMDYVFIGMGCTIKGDIFIDNETFIGMQSNVLKSVEGCGNMVYGNPAKIIKK